MPEVTLNDEFGRAIAETIHRCRIQSMIEIGSWDGTGSTTVIVSALRDAAEPRLVCVEPDIHRHAALQQTVSRLPWVTTVCRKSISAASMTPKRFEDVWQSPYNRLRYAEHEVRGWWYDSHPDKGLGYLETLTDERWDAALIDGCEFSGWDDYRLLRDRVRVLMLDDVFHAYKCAEADEDLRRRGEWSCIWRSAFVRNGASIWLKTA